MGTQKGVINRVPRFSRNRRARTRIGASPIATFEFTTPNITIAFDRVVVLTGIPQIKTNTNKLPVSASQTDGQTIVLVYDTPGAVTSVTVPDNMGSVRSMTGGFMSPGTFPAS